MRQSFFKLLRSEETSKRPSTRDIDVSHFGMRPKLFPSRLDAKTYENPRSPLQGRPVSSADLVPSGTPESTSARRGPTPIRSDRISSMSYKHLNSVTLLATRIRILSGAFYEFSRLSRVSTTFQLSRQPGPSRLSHPVRKRKRANLPESVRPAIPRTV